MLIERAHSNFLPHLCNGAKASSAQFKNSKDAAAYYQHDDSDSAKD